MNQSLRRVTAGAACGVAAGCVFRAVMRNRRRFPFRDAVVLITGGSRGLGLLLARHFGAEGARIAICARNRDELERAKEDLHARGIQVLAVECDVSDRGHVNRLVSKVEERWGGVDVLVNNAGIIEVGPAEEMTIVDFEQAMKVHFWGPLLTTLAVLPAMRRRRRGRIVNVASIGGIISVPHLLPYCASKFALVGLSEGWRASLTKDGIYVSTVCPGPMRTGSPVHARFKGRHQAEYVWFTLADSVPVVSIGGARAARKIVEACRYGDAEVVLSLPAKVGSVIHGIAPGLVADALALVDRWLPAPGGIGTRSMAGRNSRPQWLPHWVTSLTDEAALANNELHTFRNAQPLEISR